ncbi:MAG: hypothetical protein DRI90_17640 [Deltaproteobacteria bacterium]|nr:MAG: hypothetical protein DRI90_17640 [Deltaproteobacteria bacterium]
MGNRRVLLQYAVTAGAALALQPSKASAEQRVRPPGLPANKKRKARRIGNQLVRSKTLAFKELDQLVSQTPRGDIVSTLFVVFRESIEQTNEDKLQWLSKLKQLNDISEALGDYLKGLCDGLNIDTDGKAKAKGEDNKCTPAGAADLAARLERARRRLEGAIRKAGKRKLDPPAKLMLASLDRDRRLLVKAKSIYSRLPSSKKKKK